MPSWEYQVSNLALTDARLQCCSKASYIVPTVPTLVTPSYTTAFWTIFKVIMASNPSAEDTV
jgi:hypothetical protein